jgi:hypothetical protein
LLRFPIFSNLELPPQCMELVLKAKYLKWNHFWLHIVDALTTPSQVRTPLLLPLLNFSLISVRCLRYLKPYMSLQLAPAAAARIAMDRVVIMASDPV